VIIACLAESVVEALVCTTLVPAVPAEIPTKRARLAKTHFTVARCDTNLEIICSSPQ